MRQKYRVTNAMKLILMAAVIHKQKSMQIGLQTFRGIKRKLPDSKMMIVGDGEHPNFLKQLTHDLELDGEVIVCGAAPNDQMVAYYNACDLFLNPTLRWEGLTITTVEAMSCGKPIVISRIGGTQSTIEDGINGFFVDVGDVDMIEQKCIAISSNSPLAEKMGHNTPNSAISRFSQEQMAEDVVSVSENIINHLSSGPKADSAATSRE